MEDRKETGLLISAAILFALAGLAAIYDVSVVLIGKPELCMLLLPSGLIAFACIMLAVRRHNLKCTFADSGRSQRQKSGKFTAQSPYDSGE